MNAYPVNRLALHMTIALCLGIFACGGNLELLWRGLIVAGGFGMLFACRRRELLQRAFFLGLSFTLGFVLMGHHLEIQEPLAPLVDEEILVIGRVIEATERKTWLHLQLEKVNGQLLREPITLRIKKSYGDTTAYAIGSTQSFRGLLQTPQKSRNPGGFDERDFLFSRGIHYTLQAHEEGRLRALPQGASAWLNDANTNIQEILKKHLSPDHRALVAAVLFGETEQLHEDFYAFTQRIGIIHVFSVSGLHVGFIVAFILGAAAFIGRQHSPYLLFLMTPLLALYVVLSHASPPAMRAALMAIIGLLALRMLRHKDLLLIIGIVALFMLIPAPYLFWDIGFRLSFMITFGIVYGYDAVLTLFGFLPQGFRQAFALVLTAELVSAPMVAWYFYVFAPLSILANLLLVPLFSFLVPMALLGILVAQVSDFLAGLIFWPTRIIMEVIIAMIQGLEAFFGSAHLYLGQPPIWILLLYGALLALFFSGRLRVYRGRNFQLPAFILVSLLLLNFHSPLDRNQYFTVLDVGQGSSAVARSPQGQWFVFDTGPGKDTTAQFLRYAGCRRVDAVILSHGDSDHIRGLRHILRDFKVDRLFVESKSRESEIWPEIAALIYKKGVQLHCLEEGAIYEPDATCRIEMRTLEAPWARDNVSQLVARFEVYDLSILIPGDVAPQSFQDDILCKETDLLLVPHHGSRANWDRSFYETSNARLAIVSAGSDNRFGHPHEEVLEGLKALGIPLLRTDEEGAICFHRSSRGIVYKTPCKKEM